MLWFVLIGLYCMFLWVRDSINARLVQYDLHARLHTLVGSSAKEKREREVNDFFPIPDVKITCSSLSTKRKKPNKKKNEKEKKKKNLSANLSNLL